MLRQIFICGAALCIAFTVACQPKNNNKNKNSNQQQEQKQNGSNNKLNGKSWWDQDDRKKNGKKNNNGGWKETKDMAGKKNVVQMAMGNRDLATLVAALKAADLDKTLEGKGPFTIFAPTDKAFDDMPKGKLDELLKPENKGELKKILTLHIVAGRLTNAEIGKLHSLRTIQGQSISVRVQNGKLYVDDAEVSDKEITADNGIIHPINKVAMPK